MAQRAKRHRDLLTFERVHIIRTSGLTDAHFERLWRVGRGAIRYARVGKTWAEHPTPVDKRPRYGGGLKAGKEALLA